MYKSLVNKFFHVLSFCILAQLIVYLFYFMIEERVEVKSCFYTVIFSSFIR